MLDLDVGTPCFNQHRGFGPWTPGSTYVEDKVFNFPADVSRDFTIIDGGSAIGITVSYGRDLRAVWHFDDEGKKRRFNEMRRSLEDGSYKFEEILKWWEKQRRAVREPSGVS